MLNQVKLKKIPWSTKKDNKWCLCPKKLILLVNLLGDLFLKKITKIS